MRCGVSGFLALGSPREDFGFLVFSRYRLQIHHITRWADGGRTDPQNLTTLCWFHHHVAIHGQGFTIDPHSPPQRRRLLQPPIHGPPWLEHARQRGMTITEHPTF